MHIWKRCWNFSPEVWTINAQSPKTILKNSKKITFLKVLLWTSKLVLTTFPNDFIEFSKNCAHSPERTKSFLTKSFLIDMFLLAGGIQFGSPCREWYNEKTKKCSLDVGKRSEKVNFPSILFFQLPIWRPNRVCKISAANLTFPCPKSEVVSQSQHIVFPKVFLWTSKMHVNDSVEKFHQSSKSFGWKCKLNWKKNRFFEWNSSKSSRTFRMKLWQNWRNFFSELSFFFARTRS